MSAVSHSLSAVDRSWLHLGRRLRVLRVSRAHSFSPASYGCWCRRGSVFYIWAADYVPVYYADGVLLVMIQGQGWNVGEYLGVVSVGLASTARRKICEICTTKTELEVAGSKVKYTCIIIALTLIRYVSIRWSWRNDIWRCGCYVVVVKKVGMQGDIVHCMWNMEKGNCDTL